MKLKLSLLTSLFSLFMSASVCASPCENNRVRSLDEAWEASSVALSGRVKLLEELKTDTTDYIRVGVVINHAYKGQDLIGKLTKEIELVMPASGAQGRQNFLVGSNYTLFGQWKENLEKFYTSVCWRNNALNTDGFNEDVERLLILGSNQQPEEALPSDVSDEALDDLIPSENP